MNPSMKAENEKFKGRRLVIRTREPSSLPAVLLAYHPATCFLTSQTATLKWREMQRKQVMSAAKYMSGYRVIIHR